MKSFVFTCGDVNGIGPEIVLKTLNKFFHNHLSRFIFVCPENIFNTTAAIVQPKFNFQIVKNILDINNDRSVVWILSPFKKIKQTLGAPTKISGTTAFDALKLSFQLIQKKYADAVITAPISKTAISKAGIKYPGQTEMFASWCKEKKFVMTFLSNNMNAALYSIHTPLKKVTKTLNLKRLSDITNVLFNMLKSDLGIRNPSIAILGLNPHAGEYGLIGEEENNIITPFIKKNSKKYNVSGPYSPDAFFASKSYQRFNLILGMYHDQILIPYKLLNRGRGVNYTAGLPIVRTSPDHGVAFDIAGKNIADESSMIEAFKYADKIVENRYKYYV